MGTGACFGTIAPGGSGGPAAATWRVRHLLSWTAGQVLKWLQAWGWSSVEVAMAPRGKNSGWVAKAKPPECVASWRVRLEGFPDLVEIARMG
eukprot:7555172-Alexandrium_andersonii.AAC.1